MRFSISQLADMTGFDRETIKRRLQPLTYTEGPRDAKLYESRDALPLLYASDLAANEDEKESLTAARTNESNAKAKKTWIEVEALEKKRIPLETFYPEIDTLFGAIGAVIKKSSLPARDKEEITTALRELPSKLVW